MGDSFTHLHVHTEFSMLDGAARLDELVAKAAADGQPALGITDHGNMYGVLDFYRECRKQGIKPIIGTEAYMAHESPRRASDAPRPHRRLRRRRRGRQEALLPPHPAGREQHRVPQPAPALQPGVPRGLLLQATDGLGAARPLQRRPDRDHRLPRRPRAPAPGPRRRGRCARRRRSPAGHLRRATTCSSSCRTTVSPRRSAPTRSCWSIARGSARRCSPPTTRTTPTAKTTRATTRCSACRPVPCCPTRTVQVRGPRALPEVGRRDAVPVHRAPGGVRQHAVDRRAGRRRRSSSARRCCPTSRSPRGSPTTPRTSITSRGRAPRERWGDDLPPAVGRAARLRAEGHRRHGVRLVLPHHVGPHQARPRRGHPRRSRPRLGRRLRRRLLPVDHRPRPDQVRPAVRAVPQPEPDLDARHRHGLRLPLPRRDDPLRRRTVRPRPRRPDHHVRHDQGPQRSPRRRPRARVSRTASATGSPRRCRRW